MMKKHSSIALTILLLFTTTFSQVPTQALESTAQQAVSNDGSAQPVFFLEEYNGYNNVVGCLNSDGTKTVYLFGDGVNAQTVEAVTGLSVDTETAQTLTTSGAQLSVMDDTTVYSNMASTNYGSQTYYEVGTNTTRGVARTYIKFNLSALSGVTNSDNIISAYFHLTHTDSLYSSVNIDAYLVQEDWSESGITWSTQPDYYAGEPLGTLSYYYTTASNTLEYYPNDFYITKAVKAWVQGISNYGICLKEKEDNINRTFASSENTSNVPYLCVTYTDENLVQTPGIISGQKYYIVNKSSEKYMHANSLMSGSDVYQTTGTGAALQNWTLTYLNNGYYSIKVNGTTACLEVADGSTSNGANIQVGSYTGADKQQWKILRNWNGSYRLMPKLSPTKAAGIDLNATANGASVYQRAYIANFDFNDEWSIVPVTGGEASAFCFNSDAAGIDTTTGMNLLSSYIDKGRYTTHVYTDNSASVGFARLQASPLFVFSGHGFNSQMNFYLPNTTKSVISTYNNSDILSSNIYRIDQLTSNALSHQQLLLMQSCLTGCNYENTSLVGQAYRLGSHNIISNTCVTNVGPDSDWLLWFFMNLSLSRNIGAAKARADENLYEHTGGRRGGILQRHELGDDSVYLQSYPTSAVAASASVQPMYQDDIALSEQIAADTIQVQVDNHTQALTAVSSYTQPIYNTPLAVYKDANGGIYTFYQDTNKLQSYQPYTGGLKLGETVIDEQKAFSLAESFLAGLDYDVTNFVCEHSNEYSKTYRIAYQYLLNGAETSEKIVLYMQADENGDVYLINFMAYDYGMFSQDSSNVPIASASSAAALQKMQAIQNTYGDDVSIDRIYWTKNDAGVAVRKALITANQNGSYVTQLVDF